MSELVRLPDGSMLNPADAEPVLSTAALTAAATAVIALLIEFGVPINEGQQNAIVGVLPWLALAVAAVWARSRAWSPKSVSGVAARGGW